MHPELFSIQLGNFVWVVKAYSFFYFIAALVVALGTFWLAKKRGFKNGALLVFIFGVIVGGFVGARILHWFTNQNAYVLGEYNLFSLDMEGFAFSGGIIGALLIGYLLCRKLKIDFWKLGDTSIVFLGVGIAIARVGCFLNGCCFGKSTKLPWGVNFPELSQAHQYQLSHGVGSFFGVAAVHPTQLYEALAALIGSLMAVHFIRKKVSTGVAILLFGLWFSFFRLLNMRLRVMPSTFDAPEFFYPIFYVSVMIMCGGMIWIKLKNSGNFR
ncbi:MAG: prolipoprotein diacylglyceryl transferase [Candidatus Moranbacteria bacterium]|jgi:phosphatidylglycerol:prolipoprotein diacylglycerol transferase|nr:prolipoprotein diacylglyceryl transferase [Candidatus Moranbacteria bacterium]